MKIRQVYVIGMTMMLAAWALWNYEQSLWLAGRAVNIMMPFIMGCCMAFILNLFMGRLEKLWSKIFTGGLMLKLRRPFCLLLTLLLAAGFAALVFLLVIPELNSSVRALMKLVPPAVSRFNVFLHERLLALNLSASDYQYLQARWSEFYSTAINFLYNNKSLLLSRTLNITASVVDIITNLVIGFVAAVYLLLEKERLGRNLRRTVYAFCSRERGDYLVDAAAQVNCIFAGYVGGQLLEAFLLGCLCFAGMLLFGFPYALVISVLVASLALVPILGTIISALVGCLLILVAAPDKILGFVLFFFVLQRVEGDLLYPKIVGKAVGLSEIWVLAAVTAGGSLGGIIGMIISVPLCSVAYHLFSQKVGRNLAKKNLNDL